MTPKNNKKNPSSKIKIRGKDNTPLTSADIQQGLLEAAKRLKPYPDYRAKVVTVYILFMDEDGKAIWLPADAGQEKGTWEIYPYRSAAADHGL